MHLRQQCANHDFSSDYSLFFLNGGAVAWVNGTNYANLAAWQAASRDPTAWAPIPSSPHLASPPDFHLKSRPAMDRHGLGHGPGEFPAIDAGDPRVPSVLKPPGSGKGQPWRRRWAVKPPGPMSAPGRNHHPSPVSGGIATLAGNTFGAPKAIHDHSGRRARHAGPPLGRCAGHFRIPDQRHERQRGARQDAWTLSNPIAFDLATPQVTAISPATAYVEEVVAITGNYFGAVQGNSRVLFGTTASPAQVITWSPTGITVRVPRNTPASCSIFVELGQGTEAVHRDQ